MKSQINKLVIKNLRVAIGSREILHGLDLVVAKGTVHAIMGPNGSGKSTLASALLGHPAYTVTTVGAKIQVGTTNLIDASPEERAKKGLFLAFQSPISIPGVSVMNLLRSACSELAGGTVKQKGRLRVSHVGKMTMAEFTKKIKEAADVIGLDHSLLARSINDGFSGGERKKIEMLQALVLNPKFAVFDEIDTGLDVDALKSVARAIDALCKKGCGVIIITHYNRILRYVTPDVVHVLVKGKIVKTGDANLAKAIEENGYKEFIK